jgi:hypothetical protein
VVSGCKKLDTGLSLGEEPPGIRLLGTRTALDLKMSHRMQNIIIIVLGYEDLLHPPTYRIIQNCIQFMTNFEESEELGQIFALGKNGY